MSRITQKINLVYECEMRTDRLNQYEICIRYMDETSQKTKRLLLPRSHVGNPRAVYEALMNAGALLPADPAKALALIRDILAKPPQKRQGAVTDRVGWTNDGEFVLRHECFYPGDDDPVTEHRDTYLKTARKPHLGKLAEWRSAVDEICAASNYAVFAVGLALSGPTLWLQLAQTGLAFNLSGQSGAGKTSLLQLAQSVVRRAHHEDIKSLNATSTHLEEHAAENSDGFFALDEFGAVKGAQGGKSTLVKEIAYGLREGKGRARGKLGAASVGQSDLRFRVAILTSSEMPLTTLAGGQRDEGEIARFVDIAVPSREDGGIFDVVAPKTQWDEKKRRNCLDALTTKLLDHYGVANRALIEELAEDLEKYREKVRKDTKLFSYKLEERFPKVTQIRYREAFGMIYAALALSVDLEIVPFKKKRAKEAIFAMYEQSEFLRTASDTASKMLQRLAEEVAHPSICPVVTKGKPASADNLWAIRRTQNSKQQVVIYPQGLAARYGKEAAAKLEEEMLRRRIQLKAPNGKSRQQVAGTGLGHQDERPRMIVLDYDLLLKTAALKAQ